MLIWYLFDVYRTQPCLISKAMSFQILLTLFCTKTDTNFFSIMEKCNFFLSCRLWQCHLKPLKYQNALNATELYMPPKKNLLVDTNGIKSASNAVSTYIKHNSELQMNIDVRNHIILIILKSGKKYYVLEPCFWFAFYFSLYIINLNEMKVFWTCLIHCFCL